MEFLKMVLKLLVAGFFVIGLDILIPFTTFGLDFVQEHGKLLLFVIGAFNVFVGGGLSGGFLDNDLKVGFNYWGKPLSINGELNPTYGFAGLILVINVLEILFVIQP